MQFCYVKRKICAQQQQKHIDSPILDVNKIHVLMTNWLWYSYSRLLRCKHVIPSSNGKTNCFGAVTDFSVFQFIQLLWFFKEKFSD